MKSFMSVSVTLLLLIYVACDPAYGGEADATASTPYGICSHLIREEFGAHQRSMEMMREAGIQWIRADFSWSRIQPAEHEWNFERCDTILASAAERDIDILPILNYNNRFANPAWQHLDMWETYVNKVVTRYQKQLPVWEVWNEQNLQNFWQNPDPANYLTLLKRSYETIKAVNPELLTAVGGYAGVPFDFIESIYQLGGGKFFDIMNVHPYSHPMPPELTLEERLIELRRVMSRYGDADKPIWITEIGWPTPLKMSNHPAVVRVALDRLLEGKESSEVIYLKDPDPNRRSWLPKIDELREMLPAKCTLQIMDYPGLLSAIESQRIDVVIMPVGENYYLDEIDRIVGFVRDGGIIVDIDLMPLWYGFKNKGGRWIKTDASAHRRFRISTEAWWNDQELIPKELALKPVGPASGLTFKAAKITATRFLKPHAFKLGDRFVPLMQGRRGKYTGTAAAIYDFNSDWKGALVVSTLPEEGALAVDSEGQARMLLRALLIARRCGVAKTFWYEFQSPEFSPTDKEAHFGIIHRNFTAKPAYNAYRTLTHLMPPDARFLEKPWHTDDKSLYYPQWRSSDGVIHGALWAFAHPGTYKIRFSSKPRFTSLTGEPSNRLLDSSDVVMELNDTPVYFSGAEMLAIQSHK